MCRLAFIPGRAKVNYKELLEFFNHLQTSCGGDGNGYVAVSEDGRTLSNKAAKLSNGQIVKQTYKLIRDGWSVYYHTRKVSVGWISDEQCHPFEIKGRMFKGYLCHNGTWYEGQTMAKYFGVGSDTAALAKLIGQFGLKNLKDRKLLPESGVFLLYGSTPTKQPMHRVLHISGDLEYCPVTGVWASEFGETWKHWNDTYYVEKGRHMLEKPAPKRAIQSSWVQQGSSCSYKYVAPKTTPRYASDIDSNWFRRAYQDEKDNEIDGLDYVTEDTTLVDRNLLR